MKISVMLIDSSKLDGRNKFIGTNLNCLNGIMPNQDKLIQLSLYKQLIEAKFNRSIPWISGGTSVTLSLLIHKQIPPGINHFRIGEALFFGNDLFTGKQFEGMESDVFKLFAEIIELYEKPIVPNGDQIENIASTRASRSSRTPTAPRTCWRRPTSWAPPRA